MKLIKKLLLCLTMSALFITQGCHTVTVRKGPVIVMDEKGRIYVRGKHTGLKDMVKRLKAEGYEPESDLKATKRGRTNHRSQPSHNGLGRKTYGLTIQVPQNVSKNALRAISSELASHGYTHIAFVQKLKPTVELGADPILKGVQR